MSFVVSSSRAAYYMVPTWRRVCSPGLLFQRAAFEGCWAIVPGLLPGLVFAGALSPWVLPPGSLLPLWHIQSQTPIYSDFSLCSAWPSSIAHPTFRLFFLKWGSQYSPHSPVRQIKDGDVSLNFEELNTCQDSVMNQTANQATPSCSPSEERNYKGSAVCLSLFPHPWRP